ncbi:lysophospholipid acyltransferase family protein [Alkaliphilus hydrothermalis]|uniref:1-acyl-sn-glycerol-3-phosphate acyltransferase n=1 Tax=Alkaliphilus hydrothermalis TaxID=1482730 RepID=A0ABS2NPS0_9FIRM|nr:lysophospholipid acyltransferase family protein [Alkaliphilus hydrothermalis]MBM7614907.1 1-acyl-sn-glycerol-3-phosphate acyltransferase [Alkaliphilus hydrothermalis]
MRTIFWFASFWIYTVFTLFYIPRVKRLIKKGLITEKRQFAHRVAGKWAKTMVSLTGGTVEVIGLENIPQDGAVLFASNHQGNFDIPLLLSSISKPIGFVAKVELERLPFINTWMKLLECVFIDRKDMRQSLRTISTATEILKSGQSMVIFPEGTRSKGKEMQPFKPGSLRLAQKAGTPVVPVTISGSYRLMEGNNNRIKPAHVKIIFAPPVDPQAIDKASDLTVTVFDIIEDNLTKHPS